MFDVIIIGMGAAGSYAALNLDSNLKVLAIDSNKEILKKFLISGGGVNCNITNTDTIENTIKNNTTQDGKFLYSTFDKHFGSDTLKFLDKHGIGYENRDPKNLKIYLTQGNLNFQSFVFNELEKNLNFKLNLSEKFRRIIIEDQKIIVFTNDNKYETKKIIFATGGASYSFTGSDGYIVKICESLDLKVSPLYAIGNSLNFKNNIFRDLAGISLEGVKLFVLKNKKVIAEELGDMMITHNGIGGVVVRRISYHFENNDELEIRISFMKKEVIEFELFKKKFLKLHECFRRIPKNFRNFLLSYINLSSNTEIHNLTKNQINDIIDVFSNLTMGGIQTTGLKASVATAGGIKVSQINPTTMSLKTNPDIYFIGECLSVGMKTGGYNMTMSFSTAFSCAMDINKKIV